MTDRLYEDARGRALALVTACMSGDWSGVEPALGNCEGEELGMVISHLAQIVTALHEERCEDRGLDPETDWQQFAIHYTAAGET